MRDKSTLVSVALLFGSCATVSDIGGGLEVANFDYIKTKLGQRVLVNGIVSRTHGASGIYLSAADLRNENNRCIAVEPFVETPHGSRVKLAGVIEKTKCGGEEICTNVCGGYLLSREAM